MLDYGCRYEGAYVIGDLKYIVLSGESDAGDALFLQYYAVVNSRMTTVSIYTSLAKVTVQQRAVLKQVVNSTRFLSITKDPDPSLDWLVPPPLDTFMTYGGRTALGMAIGAGIFAAVMAVRRRCRKKALLQQAPEVRSFPPYESEREWRSPQ